MYNYFNIPILLHNLLYIARSTSQILHSTDQNEATRRITLIKYIDKLDYDALRNFLSEKSIEFSRQLMSWNWVRFLYE